MLLDANPEVTVPETEIVRTTTSLPKDTHRRVNLAAAKMYMAFGQVVLYALIDWLENLPDDIKRSIEFDMKHGPIQAFSSKEQAEAWAADRMREQRIAEQRQPPRKKAK